MALTDRYSWHACSTVIDGRCGWDGVAAWRSADAADESAGTFALASSFGAGHASWPFAFSVFQSAQQGRRPGDRARLVVTEVMALRPTLAVVPPREADPLHELLARLMP